MTRRAARATVDGLGMAYDRAGQGPPMLAIHGWASDRRSFDALRPFLSAQFAMVLPDLPGFGASADAVPDDLSLPATARRLLDLLDHLSVTDPVMLAGHSMGALLSLEMLRLAPARCAGAVLLDPAPIVWQDRSRAGMEATLAGLEQDLPGTLAGLRERAFFRRHEPQWVRDAVAQAAEPASADAIVRGFRAMLDWDGPAALAAAAGHRLLYVAADRPQNREADLRALAPNLHWGQTVGHGHFAHMMAPDQVTAMIATFLTLPA